MAEKAKEATAAKGGDDWLGGDVVGNDLPRFAIGDPKEAREGTKVLMAIQGVYEDTIAQTIDGKVRLLHRIRPRDASKTEGKERILLWGNHQIDQVLPTLVPGTRFSAAFQGKRNIGGGRTLKDILVQYPAAAETRPNPFAQSSEDEAF